MNSPQQFKENSGYRSSVFNPEEAFLDLKVVRITITAIVATAILVTALIAFNTGLSLNLSGDGFNYAVAQFKVPIGILTVSIPLLALLAANHRSEQTKRQMHLTTTQISRTDQQISRADQQIKISQGQNIFSNYFKHLEEFDKRFNSKKNSQPFLSSPHRSHQKFFPDAKRGILTISPKVLAEVSGHAASFIDSCRGFSMSDWTGPSKYIHQHMKEMTDGLQISQGTITGIQVSAAGGNFTLINGSVPGSIIHFIEIFKFLDEVFGFDETYSTPENILNIINLNVSFLPDHTPGKGFVPFDIDRLIQLSNENLSKAFS